MGVDRLAAGEPFHIFGFSEDQQRIYILSGWFEKDEFDLPYSDTIIWLGSIVISPEEDPLDDKELPENIVGFTSEQRLVLDRASPLVLPSHELSVMDLNHVFLDKFVSLFINRSAKYYYSPGGESLLTYPLNEEDDLIVGDLATNSCVYIEHYVRTDGTVMHEFPSAISPDERGVDLTVGIFRNSARLAKSVNLLLESPANPDCLLTRNFRHILHPVYVTNTDTLCPTVTKPPESKDGPNLVLDPHLILPARPGGLICHPSFYFYHYECDKVSDSGWGCAYRTLQSIISWFRSNYQIFDHVHSIEEIQDMIRKADYAHATLSIGSKVWIGSVEIATVLSNLSQNHIACRILHARTLPELETYLLTVVKEHLVNVGIPFMVGAGSYSFTLAGIDVETKSVLIVDPHFEDPSRNADANKAVAKGFIGWKRIAQFFDFKKVSGNFINICLPYIE